MNNLYIKLLQLKQLQYNQVYNQLYITCLKGISITTKPIVKLHYKVNSIIKGPEKYKFDKLVNNSNQLIQLLDKDNLSKKKINRLVQRAAKNIFLLNQYLDNEIFSQKAQEIINILKQYITKYREPIKQEEQEQLNQLINIMANLLQNFDQKTLNC